MFKSNRKKYIIINSSHFKLSSFLSKIGCSKDGGWPEPSKFAYFYENLLGPILKTFYNHMLNFCNNLLLNLSNIILCLQIRSDNYSTTKHISKIKIIFKVVKIFNIGSRPTVRIRSFLIPPLYAIRPMLRTFENLVRENDKMQLIISMQLLELPKVNQVLILNFKYKFIASGQNFLSININQLQVKQQRFCLLVQLTPHPNIQVSIL